MQKEPRPNWLASIVAVAAVLVVGLLLREAFKRLGFTLAGSRAGGVANVVLLLVGIAAVNLTAMRLARASWGSVGQHVSYERRTAFVASLVVSLVAGIATYVIALLVLLGFGWTDDDRGWLYPVAVTAAIVAAGAAAAVSRRSQGAR